MIKTNLTTVVVSTLTTLAFAGAVIAATVLQERAITGAILDSNCAKSFLHAENIEMAVADHHSIECTLSDTSLKSGLVVMVGKRIIKIDPASNAIVVEFLKGPNAAQIARVIGSDGPNGFVVKSVRPSSNR